MHMHASTQVFTMENEINEQKWAATGKLLLKIKYLFSKIKNFRHNINNKGEKKFSEKFIVIFCCAAAALATVLILFIPPYIGMADDGSYESTINPLGIYHIEESRDDIYFNYYTKNYMLMPEDHADDTPVSGLKIVVIAAKALDTLFTHDSYFDLRFLALIYALLFLPAFFLILKTSLCYVRHFTERIVVSVLALFIFTDVSYIAYFGSFYTDPLVYIAFLYIVTAMLRLREQKHNYMFLAVFTFSTIILTITRNQYAAVGFLSGVYAVRYFFLNKDRAWRFASAAAALLIFLTSFYSAFTLPSDFTDSSKYNAMTRGVLFEAKDPEDALESFGIDPSFAVLSGTSSYDKFVTTPIDNATLKKEFLDKYDNASLTAYYLRNPGATLGMLDISVGRAVDSRRTMSGNFEKSLGMPKMARCPVWSVWSFFKAMTIPGSIGFVLVLLIAVILLFKVPRRRVKGKGFPRITIPLETMIYILLVSMIEALITIVCSGDAELIGHITLLTASIDLLIFFCFAKVLHRLNAF